MYKNLKIEFCAAGEQIFEGERKNFGDGGKKEKNPAKNRSFSPPGIR